MRKIRSINGKPVHAAHEVEAMVEALLDHPPADVRFWQGSSGPKRPIQVSYVRRATMERLLGLMSSLEIEKLARVHTAIPDATPTTQTLVETEKLRESFSCNDQPSEDAKSRCFQFAHAIETATEASAPSGEDREHVDCKDVGRLSRILSVWKVGAGVSSGIELRYIDWMAEL